MIVAFLLGVLVGVAIVGLRIRWEKAHEIVVLWDPDDDEDGDGDG